MAWLAVFVGGGVGSVLRYGLGLLFLRGGPTVLPWGTLVANILGSLLLAVLARVALGSDEAGRTLSEPVRLALGTGLCGGFTTYSTFNLETLSLFQEGQVGRGLVYAVATLVLCALGGLLGVWLGGLMGSRP